MSLIILARTIHRREHSRNVSQVSDFSLSAYVDSSVPRDGKPGNHRRKNRKSTNSDRSMFYFRSEPPPISHPLPLLSAITNVTSIHGSIPPLLLSAFATRRFDVITGLPNNSRSSITYAYGVCGAWAIHQSEPSISSVNSGFSGARLARSGLGDECW